MAKRKQKYLWEKKTGSSLLLWPKESVERSLIKPTAPEEFVSHNPSAKVTSPQPLPLRILEDHGIIHSAISAHSAKFYTSRDHENFNMVSYTTGGCVIMKIDGKTIRLRKGMMYFVSSKSEYTLRIPKIWKSFFFHMENSPRWNNICGKIYEVRKAKYIDDIQYPTEKYFEEVYKPNRSLKLLEMYADMIEYFLRRELSDDSDTWKALDDIVFELEKGTLKNPQTKAVARRLGISVYELDKQCIKFHGVKFAKLSAKITMETAKKALLTLPTPGVSSVASDCGYANVHSFSKAFGKYFNMSPSELVARAKTVSKGES